MILQGDCIEEMAKLDEACIDAIVCDPPYGLEFMGKEWDRLADKAHKRLQRADEMDDPVKSKYLRHSVEYVRGPAAQEWHQAWATQALRVLKPGGHLLAFGGTRTYHRLACAVEDAGFEIRDSLIWIYGSGFPKSLDVSKAIDKAAGAEREVVGFDSSRFRDKSDHAITKYDDATTEGGRIDYEQKASITAPATPEAARWEGWGTALKPSHEPIVLARKPLSGTVASNVLEHGTGALNVDGCRVGTDGGTTRSEQAAYPLSPDGTEDRSESWARTGHGIESVDAGRWPANLILSHLPECERVGTRKVKPIGATARAAGATGSGASFISGKPHPGYRDEDGLETVTAYECAPGCPVAELDRQSGERRSAGEYEKGARGFHPDTGTRGAAAFGVDGLTSATYGDTGGASRFFYQAKASRGERNAGLDGFEEQAVRPSGAKFGEQTMWNGENGDPEWRAKNPNNPAANVHPTVKPIDLMRWLCRLVTPPGGTILDPFLGSGTTGIAAHLEGFDFIGIEREAEYVAIAEARIKWWAQFPAGTTTEAALGIESVERKVKESGQGSLLEQLKEEAA